MIIYHVIWGHINELIRLNIKNPVSHEKYYMQHIICSLAAQVVISNFSLELIVIIINQP